MVNPTTDAPLCLIHIGAPKTGSTLLQKFIFENRAALAARSILYPDVNLRGFGHHDLAFLLAGGYPDWAIPQPRNLAALAADLALAARHDGTIVLSSEDFYLYPRPAALNAILTEAGILPGHRAVILVYVRRQDAAHLSWYNQTIKAQGATHDFDRCYEQWYGLWDYAAQIDAWAEVFGAENIIVRPFEAAQFRGGGLLEDFLAQAGISRDGLAVPTKPVNTGLNRDLLEFQRILNRLPGPIPKKRRFHRALMALSTGSAGNGRFDETPLLEAHRRAAILDSYAESNRRVARTYLAREDLFLEPIAPVMPPEHPRRGLTLRKLAYILGHLLRHKDGR